MTTLKWILIVVVAGWAGVVALLYVFQRSLMYFPDRSRTPPASAGLPQAEEVTLTSEDGEKLIAWHVPPREGRPLILYFHGNGGALNLRAERFGKLVADGTGLVGLSYRGYGGSTGKPTETGLIKDAEAAYAFARSKVPAERIVIFGESLGTAVAVAVAAERPSGGLILDAPFTSVADLAAAFYRFAPTRWLIRDPFYSDARIKRVKVPLLVLHGERDTIVGIAFGERLFALANEPKEFVRSPEGGHVNLDGHGAQEAIRKFLTRLYP